MKKILYIVVFLMCSIFLNINEFFIKDSNANDSKQKVKMRFTEEEDEILINFVNIYGEKSWKKIASYMPNRNTKQVRERYSNYLKPNINRDPWTKEEDKLLKEKYEEYGPRWLFIKKFFKERTEVNIKNRFVYLIRNGFKPNKNKKEDKNSIDELNNFLNAIEDFSYGIKDSWNTYNFLDDLDYHYNQ